MEERRAHPQDALAGGSGGSDPQPAAISRRDLLRVTALGGVALFLAACGSATVTPSPSTSPKGPTSTAADATLGPTPSSTSTLQPTPTPTPTPVPAVGLSHKIAGLMVVGFRGSELEDAAWVRTALAEAGLGGVILFDHDQLTGGSRNILSPAQVNRLTRDLRAAGGDRTIIVSVDQEGGIVTRLGPSHGFPAVASEATIGRESAAAARTWAHGIAATLAANGFNLTFAPVVDLDVNPTSPAIARSTDRSRPTPTSSSRWPRSSSRNIGPPASGRPSSISRGSAARRPTPTSASPT